jgi:hypothetical protein
VPAAARDAHGAMFIAVIIELLGILESETANASLLFKVVVAT